MFPAKDSDDQTEERIGHNHDNVWLAEAAKHQRVSKRKI